MIDDPNQPRSPRRFVILIASITLAFFLTTAFFNVYHGLDEKWVQPWSIQAVAKRDTLFMFIEVDQIARNKNLLASARTMSTDFFSYLITLTCQDGLEFINLGTRNKEMPVSPGPTEIFGLNDEIYLYRYGSPTRSGGLYIFRDGEFSLVPSGRADELLRPERFGTREASAHALGRSGRVLEVSGRTWVENGFEWCNSKLTIEKTNETIKLKRLVSSGENGTVHENIIRSILLPSGVVFQFVAEQSGQGSR